MLLSVIIVNYNVKYFLEQCLNSVIKALQPIDGEIIVIDNDSTDDSYSFFKNRFPGVQFVWNDHNFGFATANNQALAIAKGDYVLFLNPDTIVPEDCFEKCIGFMKHIAEGLTTTGCALGIKMLDGSGNFLKESKRAFPSPLTSLYKLFGLASLFSRSKRFGRYYLGHLNDNENHEIDVLAGAFMMVPKHILNEIGGFDEDFFMYGEDIDLSFRIQKAGYKNWYFAESCIIHFKGESTKKGSMNYIKIFYSAMSIFVKKHYGSNRAGLFSFFLHMAIFIRASFSAMARLLKWGMPVIDAGVILMTFRIAKFIWMGYIIYDVNYPSNLFNIAVPAFILLFLIISGFCRLYESGYKQVRLNKATLIVLVVILSAYSFLPESLRFLTGILIVTSLSGFIFMTLIRRLFIKWKIIESAVENDTDNQALIVGNQEEYKQVCDLLKHAGRAERVIGRIDSGNAKCSDTVGSLYNIKEIMQLYLPKEIIFCEGNLSFKKFIETIPLIPNDVSIQLFSRGSHAIIGSKDKNIPGNFIL